MISKEEVGWEGWELDAKFGHFTKKPYYSLILYPSHQKIQITMTGECIYWGRCSGTVELREIMRLLEIKYKQ